MLSVNNNLNLLTGLKNKIGRHGQGRQNPLAELYVKETISEHPYHLCQLQHKQKSERKYKSINKTGSF